MCENDAMWFCGFEDYDESEPVTEYEQDTEVRKNNCNHNENLGVENFEKNCWKQKKCYCNCCKLGEMLVESGALFERSMALFLEAESQKIQYLISNNICPKKLIEVNEQIKKTLEKIQDIERQILGKIDRGLTICGCIDDEG